MICAADTDGLPYHSVAVTFAADIVCLHVIQWQRHVLLT